MSLDDKLRKLVISYGHCDAGMGCESDPACGLADEAVEEIKQAFKDARWIEIPGKVKSTRITEELDELPTGYMTGKEWYDAFEKELNDKHRLEKTFMIPISVVFEAAKKASQIE